MSPAHYMKKAGFTRQERSLIALMRVWAIAFLITGILFAAIPDYIPNYMTNIGTGLFDWKAPPLQMGHERFWVILAVALLISLAYICAIVQKNLLRNIGYVRPVILAKLVSAFGFAACFFLGGRQFLYLAGFIVDGCICAITWRFYAAAMKSRA